MKAHLALGISLMGLSTVLGVSSTFAQENTQEKAQESARNYRLETVQEEALTRNERHNPPLYSEADTSRTSVDPSVEAVRKELEKARQAVEDARKVAEQIVSDAQREANRIKQNYVVNDGPADLGPAEMQTRKIAVEIASGTVQEIATAIMPGDWRIQVDVKDMSVLQRRFQFVSTKSRDQALRDLLLPVGLKHQYFYDLRDETGLSTPLLVISKR